MCPVVSQFLAATTFFLVPCVLFLLYSSVDALKLTILHTNDVHCRFLSYNAKCRTCTQEDIDKKQCWGGAARRQTLIKQLKQKYDNVLLLDAGDQYQGTMWFSVLGWEPIARYMNVMQYDAMCLGNHEFDLGSQGLVPFLKNITTPIVDSNIDAGGEPLAAYFNKSLTFKFSTHQVQNEQGETQTVAVVGYTSVQTPEISHPDKGLKFLDEVQALKTVVDELKSRGVDKIIALGHSGISTDAQVCRQVPGVDVVVGGHTNTFLYPTGSKQPSDETPEGPYPTVFTDTGSKCLVVQAYAFGKYLGFLQVEFDDKDGTVKSFSGQPILVDASVYEEDPEIKALLEPYAKMLETAERKIVGSTSVYLSTKKLNCVQHECPLGNIIADAFVDYYRSKMNQDPIPDVYIGLINSGGIRDFEMEAGHNMTYGDWNTILPFSDKIEKVIVSGSTLLRIMERSVERFCEDDTRGKFLQVAAGVRVTFDLSKPSKSRVQSLLVLAEDSAKVFKPVDLDKNYSVITNSYLIGGGNGYSVLRDNILARDFSEIMDLSVVLEYLEKHNPLASDKQGRISFMQDENALCSAAGGSMMRRMSSQLTVPVISLVIVSWLKQFF